MYINFCSEEYIFKLFLDFSIVACYTSKHMMNNYLRKSGPKVHSYVFMYSQIHTCIDTVITREMEREQEGGLRLKKAEIEQKCEALVMPIIEEGNFELVDVEYVKEGANYYLRVYADKEDGININDCVAISRALEVKLDEEDFIEDAYILEVSSPGLGRPLKKDKDFVRSIGEDVDIKLYKSMDGQKEFTGCLKAFDADENTVTIETEERDITVKRNEIAMIRLAFDF